MKKLREILSQLEIKMREKDYLLFRHAEFAKLAPSCDDFQAVESYVRDAGQLEKNRKLLLSAQAIIDEGYKSRILSEAFSEVRRILGAWNTPTLKNDVEEILDLLGVAESSVNDLSFGLGKCVSALDVDEYQLKEAQERLGAYRDLMRKLSVHDVSQLVEEGQKLNSELAFIDSGEELVDQLLETLYKECQALRLSARELSSARRRAFQKVKKSIQKELHELNMKGAKLDLAWLQVSHSIDGIKLQYLSNQQSSKLNDCLDILCAHNRSGAEKVQFILSSNPGESAKPLSKIASGGEISRIMLGIKSVLSAGADTCLMVFDEIDTGISGQTADIVGGKLKAMASRFQVLCISHLPQVAAYANTHFKVEKLTRSGRTESIIKALTKAQGMREVARLLSGEEITKPSLDNAKQLINNAKKS
jgi:DNA repair protein RecN (Recombination protein N)